jgi:hypothetical protein
MLYHDIKSKKMIEILQQTKSNNKGNQLDNDGVHALLHPKAEELSFASQRSCSYNRKDVSKKIIHIPSSNDYI